MKQHSELNLMIVFAQRVVDKAEAAETQTWIKFAVECKYMDVETGFRLNGIYNQVLAGLVSMINNPSPWLMKH